ncbi:hypothetical protein C2G38_2208911 [Gigaspora rosea]|uniref:Uncharacterized protein n=1 Tax=Gigaspora rosea TaxID=44941 RepID=A0A397UL06_9GLOM|nr:hypothetical protein C2G38_2208911 [Gigaspora rosea]
MPLGLYSRFSYLMIMVYPGYDNLFIKETIPPINANVSSSMTTLNITLITNAILSTGNITIYKVSDNSVRQRVSTTMNEFCKLDDTFYIIIKVINSTFNKYDEVVMGSLRLTVDTSKTFLAYMINETKRNDLEIFSDLNTIIVYKNITIFSSVVTNYLDKSYGFKTPKIFFSDIYAKVNYCKAYVTANGLSKKAIQIGLDAGSSTIQELEDLVNSFITKYALKKGKKLVNEKNIEQQENENKDISNSSSSDENFVVVENPIVYFRKNVLRKKRFKEPYEVKSNKSK